MSVYLQHCESNYGCKNLEKTVSTAWDERDENMLRETNTKSNQIN